MAVHVVAGFFVIQMASAEIFRFYVLYFLCLIDLEFRKLLVEAVLIASFCFEPRQCIGGLLFYAGGVHNVETELI